jgi:trimeric autotransporter adhesin
LEDDRRRNSSTTDIYTGNTHDYTWYDADVGIRWYTAGAEEMRLQDDGTLHVDGDVVAYSTTVSDERLKDNVTTIQNPLDKIKALRGVEYEWNAGNRKGKRDLGLIAQEVEMVIPEIVHDHKLPLIDGESGTVYKTVDYEKMVAVLIEGMKEQQTQIESLKSEIDELKGKL